MLVLKQAGRRAGALVFAAAAMALTGCAVNMKVPLKDPTPSGVAYQGDSVQEVRTIRFQDERSTEAKGKVLTGLIPMQLTFQDKPLDAFNWLERSITQDLTSRGMKLSSAQTDAPQAIVQVEHIQIENQRTSGFSPLITFTTVKANVQTPSGSRRVAAYVKRAKVPVWSFDEVIDPAFNDALSIASKEVAAKINQFAFRQAISDAEVQRLIAGVKRDGTTRDSAYLDVYQLGFGNNPSAIPALAEWTAHPAEYVRLAAISSLGNLGAVEQFSLLKRLAEAKPGMWQDRAMALKAIGDLGTPESKVYLQQQWKAIESLTDKESSWTKTVLSLYL